MSSCGCGDGSFHVSLCSGGTLCAFHACPVNCDLEGVTLAISGMTFNVTVVLFGGAASFACAVVVVESFACAVVVVESFACAVVVVPSFACAVEVVPSFACAVEVDTVPSSLSWVCCTLALVPSLLLLATCMTGELAAALSGMSELSGVSRN